MKAIAVSSATVLSADRWDAKYHCLLAPHVAAAEELAEKYDAAELVKLATDLPFDQAAADAVFCQLHPHTRSSFLAKIGGQRDAKKIRENIRFRQQMAVYCAAAAVHARARLLEELLALSRAKEALVRVLCRTAATAREKGAKHLVAAIAAKKETKKS